MIKTLHYLTHTIEVNGKRVRARYYMPMRDSEFEAIFIEGRYPVPTGWRIVHIPVEEIESCSKRYDFFVKLPIVMNPMFGVCAGWQGALRDALGVNSLPPAKGF